MILKHLDQLPPAICRLLACTSNGWKPLTHRELGKKCGLPKTKVADLSHRTTWAGVKVGVMEKFAGGCGVNLLRPAEALVRFRQNRKPYLKRGTKAQRQLYMKLLDKLLPTNGDVTRPG